MRYETRVCYATVAALLAGMLICRADGAETLKVTPKHGTIEFVGSKDDGIHVGGFKKFSGVVTLDPNGPDVSSVVLEFEIGSLWSDHPNLTAHLLDPDFFHVDEFPKAVFRSTAVRKAGPEDRKIPGQKQVTHVLNGKLSLLGVSKKIELPVKMTLTDDALTVEGAYNLDRTRFGMNYGLDKIHKEVPVSYSLKIPRKKSADGPPQG